MTNHPFTKEEALEIAEDFEDLLDTGFRSAAGHFCTVTRVVVCPFHEPQRAAFITAAYHNDVADADGDCDVVVLATADDSSASHETVDIRTFTALCGIAYSFPA